MYVFKTYYSIHDILFTGSALITAGTESEIVEEEDQTKLNCRAIKDIALCLFISPSGATYDVKDLSKLEVSPHRT